MRSSSAARRSEVKNVLDGRAAATLKRELAAAKESYQFRLRELQDRSREQALQRIAKELVRQRSEAQQLALFEEIQEEAEMGLQELESSGRTSPRRGTDPRTAHQGTRQSCEHRAAEAISDAGGPRVAAEPDVLVPRCKGGLAMSQADTAHAWWSRLRHQGLLLSPVVMVERYPTAPPAARFPLLDKLRDEYTRFVSAIADLKENENRDEAAILKWVDALAGKIRRLRPGPSRQAARIPRKSRRSRPNRHANRDDSAPSGRLRRWHRHDDRHAGHGRHVAPRWPWPRPNKYAQFLELLRGTGHRLGLLTNGSQFRLIYAGIDFESWCEWESDRWFDDGEGTEELDGLRQLLSPESLKPVKSGVSGLLDAVEESRKRQADLSSVLRENVRQAVELLLEEVSTAHRTERRRPASPSL